MESHVLTELTVGSDLVNLIKADDRTPLFPDAHFAPPPATFPLPSPQYIAYQLSVIFNKSPIYPYDLVGNFLIGGPSEVPSIYNLLNGWQAFAVYGLRITGQELQPVRTVGDLVNAIYYSLKR